MKNNLRGTTQIPANRQTARMRLVRDLTANRILDNGG